MIDSDEHSGGGDRCSVCGSRVFLVDETCTHLEIDGEIITTRSGDLVNRKCMRCNYPDLYADYADYDER